MGAGNGERGASGIEVALLIAIVAIATFGAIQVLGGHSKTKLHTAGAGIGRESGPGEGGDTGGGSSSSGGGSGSTGSPSSTTSTTAAPPTTAATTTTTRPATTTTTTTTTSTTTTTTRPATTTTTTAPTMPASASLDSGRGYAFGTQWYATASLGLTGPDGQPIVGATITATVRTYVIDRFGRGSWTETTVTLTTGSNGTVPIITGPYARSGTGRVTDVQYVVTGVAPPPGATWDGTAPSIAVDAP